MTWFANLTVYRKMAFGFGSILIIFAISSGIIFQKSQRLTEVTRLNNTSDKAIDLLDQVSFALARSQGMVRKYIITRRSVDGKAVQDAEALLAERTQQLREIIRKDKPDFLPLVDAHTAAVKRYVDEAVTPEYRLSADPTKQAEAMALVASPEADHLIREQRAAFKALSEKLTVWADSWTVTAIKTARQIDAVVLTSAFVSSIIAIAVGWFIARSIGGPLGSMTNVMQRLASGDLSVEVPARNRRDEVGKIAAAVQFFKEAGLEKVLLEKEARLSREAAEAERQKRAAEDAAAAERQNAVIKALAVGLGHMADGNLVAQITTSFSQEYEQLRADFNAAIGALCRALAEVSDKTDGINTSASEVGSASDDLSRRTEQQAAALEETAGALELITKRVEGTAKGSKEMRHATQLASEEAARSSVIVENTMNAMARIESSSTEIGEIIGVIDEIALQTNLLALNASIEAARAGDAGRGFALVASEVRTLAQRSANAANKVKDLVTKARTEVTSGVDLAKDVDAALQRIVGQISGINGTVVEIASSCEEQASGLAQVNTAIGELDRTTQQNAAMVEENTSAVLSLGNNTRDLAMLVSRFKTTR